MKVYRKFANSKERLKNDLFSPIALEYLSSYLDAKGLTFREREIVITKLSLYALQEVADHHGEKLKSIRNHSTPIHSKLGVKNGYELLMKLPLKEMFKVDERESRRKHEEIENDNKLPIGKGKPI